MDKFSNIITPIIPVFSQFLDEKMLCNLASVNKKYNKLKTNTLNKVNVHYFNIMQTSLINQI